jgi:hypothetical protein
MNIFGEMLRKDNLLAYRLFLPAFVIALSWRAVGQDTNYIAKYPFNGSFKIHAGLLTQHLDLYSEKIESDSAHSVFVPNVNSNLGFSFSWKFLSLSYSFKIPNQYYPVSEFGTTRYNNLCLSSYYKWFGFEGFYRSYEGFFQPGKNYANAEIRRDVSFMHTGLNLYFFGNSKKFSFRSAFSQSRKQIRSAGGFILMTEFGFKKVEGDRSLHKSAYDYSENFEKYKRLNYLGFGIFELRPGYAYNFVSGGGKFYVCPLALAGAGISLYHFKTDSLNDLTFALHYDLKFRLSTGYDMNKFFVNFNFEADRNLNFLSKNVILAHTYFNFNLTGGWRFGDKKRKK